VILGMERDLSVLVAKIEEGKSSASQKEADMYKLLDASQKIRSELLQKEQSLDSAEISKAQLASDLGKVRDRLAATLQDSDSLKKELENAFLKISHYEQENLGLARSLESKESETSNLQTRQTSLQTSISTLETELSDLRSKNLTLHQTQKSKDNEISRISASLTEESQSNLILYKNLHDASLLTDSLTHQITSLTTTHDTITRLKSQLTTKILDFQSQIASKDDDASTQTTLISYQKKNLEDFEILTTQLRGKN
jgi:chromosome segregation ATPase